MDYENGKHGIVVEDDNFIAITEDLCQCVSNLCLISLSCNPRIGHKSCFSGDSEDESSAKQTNKKEVESKHLHDHEQC